MMGWRLFRKCLQLVCGVWDADNVRINIIYANTLLHLPNRSANLVSMISERTLGFIPAQPGLGATLTIGLLPKLLPIITVAVPGPA
jgi:hypothetical protein